MMEKTTPRKAGELTAPRSKEVAEHPDAEPGDLRDAMQAFAKVRRQYRDTLKKLAE